MRRTLMIVLAMLSMAACARYPLGMSEAEWQALSPAQQHEARLADAALRQARAEQAAAEAEAAALAERNRLIAAYQRALPGGILYCEIASPADQFGRSIVDPVAFTLVERETRRLTVARGAFDREAVWARASTFGDVEICEASPFRDEPGFPCERLDLAFRSSQPPVSLTLSRIDALNGATITCGPYRGLRDAFGIPPHLR